MFQLLQPIWLFALACLCVPVIIYLWNQRPGKTLRVGSIALVAENAVSYKKTIKPAELLLLLLRCLLLACIAAALAAPVWKNPLNKASKGWVLLPRAMVKDVYIHFKPRIDSLLLAGMEFHYFEEGFAKEKLENALQPAGDTVVVKQISYRALIAQLNEQAGAALPVYVFTDNYLRHFAGPRTAVSLKLHWFTYTPGSIQSTTLADTTAPLHITIYSRQYPGDARYIKAALDAIQQFSKRNISIKLVTDSLAIPAKQDWLFWLANENPAIKDTRNIVQYAGGKTVAAASYILPNGPASFDPVDLYKSVVEKNIPAGDTATSWKDGFGHPLLSMQQQKNGVHYTLYTHIDPAWNELPWSDNFPQMLWQLIDDSRQKPGFTSPGAATIIDSKQLMPIIVPAKQTGIKPVAFTETKLDTFFWLLALLLFFAERLLSWYHRKTVGNG